MAAKREFSAEARANISAAVAASNKRRAGWKHKPEAKAKMSEASKRRPRRTGWKHKAETKAKMSASAMGHEVGAETRAAVAASNKRRAGWKHKPEARAKISASKIGKKRGPHRAEAREKISEGVKAAKDKTHSAERNANYAASIKRRRIVKGDLADRFDAFLEQQRTARPKPATRRRTRRAAVDPGTARRPPSVRGIPKEPLSKAQQKALGLLLRAFPGGMTGKEMDAAYGSSGWRKALRTLRDSDRDWESAINFPRDDAAGGPGLYSISPW